MKDIRTRYLSDDEADRLYRRYPQLGESYTSYCPTCDKTGKYVFKGVEHACDCEYQLQLTKHYLASGIGVTYQRLDWEDYHGPDAVLDGVAKYVTNHSRFIKRGMGLYFSGTHGTGKTLLATLVLKELVKFGYTCWSTTFAQTIEMMTAGWGDKAEKEYFQRKFLGSEVLLLDDVGRERRGGKVQLAETTFDAILRQRVQEGRATFITTNLDATELEEGYGAAVLSLVREKSLEQVFTGDDYRPQANSRELDEIMRGETRPVI